MKKILVEIMFVLLACTPVLAQTEQADDEIAPAGLPGQQISQQSQPLTLYTNKAENFVTVTNRTADTTYVVVPNTQITITNNQPITIMIFISIPIAPVIDLFVDNKLEIGPVPNQGIGNLPSSHSIRLPPGKHTIDVRAILTSGSNTNFGYREINVLTF
jgi:hypothetical protein